jgi:hypothetical protein
MGLGVVWLKTQKLLPRGDRFVDLTLFRQENAQVKEGQSIMRRLLQTELIFPNRIVRTAARFENPCQSKPSRTHASIDAKRILVRHTSVRHPPGSDPNLPQAAPKPRLMRITLQRLFKLQLIRLFVHGQ